MAEPVKTYQLSPEELEKYRQLQPPKKVRDVYTTAHRSIRGKLRLEKCRR